MVNGTAGADPVSISGGAGSVSLAMPSLGLSILNTETLFDFLTFNGLSGADVVGASGLAANSVRFTVNGGDDADALVASQGDDFVNGDAGDDYLAGGNGNDTIDGGPSNDFCDGGPGIDIGLNCETSINIP